MDSPPTQGLWTARAARHNPIKGAVSRDISVPLCEQVRKAVISPISSEGLVPGDILPSEHELCRYLGVSRTVVRQALGQLLIDDLVERARGKGTFVARPKTTEHLMSTLLGLYEDVTQRGGEVVSDVLDHSTVPAEGDVAESLRLSAGNAVVRLKRLRYVDGEPWALTTVWMPAAVGKHTFSADMRNDSLYRVLSHKGIVGVRGRRSVEAVLANTKTARLLRIPTASALLRLKSVREDKNGQPIEYFVAYHRGDRSSFEIEHSEDATLARVVNRELVL
jgi:GntR family transcriptional regulator